jgi:phage shock protein A
MKQIDFQEKVLSELGRTEEQLKTLFKQYDKIERHLEKINGSVTEHEVDIAKVKTWGSFAVIVIPMLLHFILRGM